MSDQGAELQLLRDRQHYDVLVDDAIRRARVSVWIATANVKELHVEAPPGTRARARGRYVSVLEVLEALADRGVDLRLLHGGLPSRPFREELARRASLRRGGLAMRRCPRVHLKVIAVDGGLLYLGSANFTGAGLGARGDDRHNFEAGVVTGDAWLLDQMQAAFLEIWDGRRCAGCRVRRVCPAPLDAAAAARPGGARRRRGR